MARMASIRAIVFCVMFLVVGLGNPGSQYARTRHNVGWMVLDELARRHSLDLGRRQHEAVVGSGLVNGQRVLLAKPQTYMNLSGRAVSALRRYHNIPLEHVMAVCDDLNLPLGKLRLRISGSDGGHNGLKSVAESLASRDYPRLRFGVGAPPQEERQQRGTRDFVLEAFTADEWPLVSETVARAADSLEAWLAEGMEIAMNRFNR